MASSGTRKMKKKNTSLWLPTQAGKMVLSMPLGITRYVPQENCVPFPYNKSCIDQAYIQSRWLDTGLVSFVFA